MKNKTIRSIRDKFPGYFLTSLIFGFPIWALLSVGISKKCHSYSFEHTKSIEGVVIEEKYFAERHRFGRTHSALEKIYSIDVKLPDGTIQSFDYNWNDAGKEIDSLIKKNDTIKFKEGYRPYDELTKGFRSKYY